MSTQSKERGVLRKCPWCECKNHPKRENDEDVCPGCGRSFDEPFILVPYVGGKKLVQYNPDLSQSQLVRLIRIRPELGILGTVGTAFEGLGYVTGGGLPEDGFQRHLKQLSLKGE